MAELDDRLRRDLARLGAREGPPSGAEDRVLASLQASLDGGPSGGSDVVFGAKVIATTLAITGAGLLVIKLAALALQPAPAPSQPSVTESRDAVPPLAAPPARTEPEPASSSTSAPTRSSSSASTLLETREREAEPIEDPLAVELALLEQARSSVDLEARLDLLDRHRERFPTGMLGMERDSLWITTLCELDRDAEARAALEQFVRANPRSPLRLRIRTACPQLDGSWTRTDR